MGDIIHKYRIDMISFTDSAVAIHTAVRFFARISRAGRLTKQTSCLHEWMLRETYGEQQANRVCLCDESRVRRIVKKH